MSREVQEQIFNEELLDVSGGLNLVTGEMGLGKSETSNMINYELRPGGVGLDKTLGFEELLDTIPETIQDTYVYISADVRQVVDGIIYLKKSVRKELIVYAWPKIYKLQSDLSIVTELGRIKSKGDPFFIQKGPELIIMDGKNPMKYYDGVNMTDVTDIQVYSLPNATVIDSVDAQAASAFTQIRTSGFKFGAIYRQRLIASDGSNTIFFSQPNDITNFVDNSGSDIEVAGYVSLDSKTPVTAMANISDGLIIYTINEIHQLSGDNPATFGGDETNPFLLERVIDGIGAVNQYCVAIREQSDHFFLSEKGLFTLALSDNFLTLRPGALSFKIQPAFDLLGSALKRSRIYNMPHLGQLWVVTPRRKTHIIRDKIWKLNYAVISQQQDSSVSSRREIDAAINMPWTQHEKFGMYANIQCISVWPVGNRVLMAHKNKLYEANKGLEFFDGEPIYSNWDFSPNRLGSVRLLKTIHDYYGTYDSPTGADVSLAHSWTNKNDGVTPLKLVNTITDEYGSGSYGNAGYSSAAVQDQGDFLLPIDGDDSGRIFKLSVTHASNTQTFSIFSIVISGVTGGMGA